MDGEPILPPLMAGLLERRAELLQAPLEVLTPTITMRSKTLPDCSGYAYVSTLEFPEAYASTLGLLHRQQQNLRPHVDSNSTFAYLGQVWQPSGAGDFTPSEGTGVDGPLALTSKPVGHYAGQVENFVTIGGGPSNTPDHPTWFPVPSELSSETEHFFSWRMAFAPGVDPRDFAGRILPVFKLTQEQRLTLGSESPEVYAMAIASAPGVVPCCRSSVRGGTQILSIIEGPGNGMLGCRMSFMMVLDVGGAVGVLGKALFPMAKAAFLADMESVRELLRTLQDAHGGKALPFDSDEAFHLSVRFARDIRRRKGGGDEETPTCACSVQ